MKIKKKRELIDLKNEADNTIHNTEKSLSEHKDKLAANEVEEIERDINGLKGLLTE